MNNASSTPTNTDVLLSFAGQGYLSSTQCEQMVAASDGDLRPLIDNGLVPEHVFVETISSVFGFEQISREQLPEVALKGTDALSHFLIEHEALPLSLQDGVLRVAMSDPSDQFTIRVLRSKLKCEVEACVALRSDLLDALATAYSSQLGSNAVDTAIDSQLDFPDDLDSDSSLVRELHRLIQRAVSMRASDIHFEPIDSQLRVRFRVHGILRNVHRFDSEQGDQLIARLKLMARLDVTERRHAQNGRFKFPADGRVIDLRVSTLPLHDGESVVLRLLEVSLSQRSLQELGFSASLAASVKSLLASQQGLVLITGPTGSGKSTTLYSLLNQLNTSELKLISIEDPVEINMTGVNQIQVDEEHGLSFSAALKTVLRQDPDVIMVGEIRDAETAQLAAQAALTGHLVLATLHTASAPSAITRLANLGLPEYLVSATVVAVLAQRLLRRVCHDCLDQSQTNTCSTCAGSGYSERITIAELLPASAFDGAAEMSEESLSAKLLDGLSLEDDARRLLDKGLVDSTEVLRVLGISA